jgi:hypothetical protein
MVKYFVTDWKPGVTGEKNLFALKYLNIYHFFPSQDTTSFSKKKTKTDNITSI